MQYNKFILFFFPGQTMKFNTSHLKVMSTITCKFKKFSLSIKSSLDVLFRMLKIIFCFCFLLFFILISQCVTESFQSCLTLCDCQVPLSLGIFFQQKYWNTNGLAMLCSRGSSWPRDWTHVSYIPCIGRQILYH